MKYRCCFRRKVYKRVYIKDILSILKIIKMSKRWIILMIILVIVPLIHAEEYKVLNACPTDLSFTERLISTCRLRDGKCNDGEWLLLDFECKLNEDIIYQMWFIRTLLLISFILLIKDNKYFPISALFIIILFYLNGFLF